jgi:sugar lactone lactonase YvrE
MKARLLLLLSLTGCGGDEGPCDPNEPNTICTIAGDGTQIWTTDFGPALEDGLYVPQDVAVAPDGEIWVLDFNNLVVRVIDKDGMIRRVIGNGEVGDDPDPGIPKMPAIDATFNHTSDLFFHDGYLYMAAWHNSRIKRVSLATMELENFAGLGRRTFYDGDGGPALQASLDLPSSITLDPAGNIVIMDQANQVIRRINKSDGTIDRIAGICIVDLDQPCAAGEVPQACGGGSNKFACGDLATECEKPCTPGYGGDGGDALFARMAQPYGQAADPAGRLTYDLDGNLLFADSENNRIRKVDRNGIMTTLAGTGVAGYSGDDGPAVLAKINRPIDIEVGDDGNVYFTDVDNSCVRKIDAAGTISRVVGRCSANHKDRAFGGDGGDPLDAKLDRPYGIELVGKKMYVSDSYNNRIRVVNLR